MLAAAGLSTGVIYYLSRYLIRSSEYASQASKLLGDWHVYHWSFVNHTRQFAHQIWRVQTCSSLRHEVVAFDALRPELKHTGRVIVQSGQVVMTFKDRVNRGETCFVRFGTVPTQGPGDTGMVLRGCLLDYDLDGVAYSAAVVASSQPLTDETARCALQEAPARHLRFRARKASCVGGAEMPLKYAPLREEAQGQPNQWLRKGRLVLINCEPEVPIDGAMGAEGILPRPPLRQTIRDGRTNVPAQSDWDEYQALAGHAEGTGLGRTGWRRMSGTLKRWARALTTTAWPYFVIIQGGLLSFCIRSIDIENKMHVAIGFALLIILSVSAMASLLMFAERRESKKRLWKPSETRLDAGKSDLDRVTAQKHVIRAIDALSASTRVRTG